MSHSCSIHAGERTSFAIHVVLIDEPGTGAWSTPDVPGSERSDERVIPARVEIWADNRCLTASAFDGELQKEIEWDVVPIVAWLSDAVVRLLNEEAFPILPAGADIQDAVDWFGATLDLPDGLSEADEDRWWKQRSEWWQHHGFRRAALDAVLPQIAIRRVGHDIELSWNHEEWPAAGSGRVWVERSGRTLVDAGIVASVISDVLTKLAPMCDVPLPRPPMVTPNDSDWTWLVAPAVRELLPREFPGHAAQIADEVARTRSGYYMPHTTVTDLLRGAHDVDKAGLDALLTTIQRPAPRRRASERFLALRNPRRSETNKPWEAGNAHAATVRNELGWGDKPAPNLALWLARGGIRVDLDDRGVPPSYEVIAWWHDGLHATAYVNSRTEASASASMLLASALGHLLLDDGVVGIQGRAEDRRVAARARAFAAALLLPESGIRSALASTERICRESVNAVAKRYGTGPVPVIRRLENLRMIRPEQRDRLLESYAAG